MGLVAIGMGPADQNALGKLEPEIIKTLRNASSKIRQGNAESLLWFGDNTQGWISRLSRDLNKMASILNPAIGRLYRVISNTK